MKHPDHMIPLAKRTFPKAQVAPMMLVMQFVNEIGTGRTYFRFVSPNGKIEGHAGNAENAYELALAIAAKLGIEIHDEVIHVSI